MVSQLEQALSSITTGGLIASMLYGATCMVKSTTNLAVFNGGTKEPEPLADVAQEGLLLASVEIAGFIVVKPSSSAILYINSLLASLNIRTTLRDMNRGNTTRSLPVPASTEQQTRQS
ncbi:hypothetical protein BDQ17DRAFT_1337221 [Cyathus striatus]|nr:hypothetical protein BDQ17DRAFT_1337221 [Cyathus striatus]